MRVPSEGPAPWWRRLEELADAGKLVTLPRVWLRMPQAPHQSADDDTRPFSNATQYGEYQYVAVQEKRGGVREDQIVEGIMTLAHDG